MKDTIRNLIESSPVPCGSTDGTPETDKPVLFRGIHLGSGWTWTAYEADPVEMDDILCFGRVDGFESELGYFSVDELLENGVIIEMAQ